MSFNANAITDVGAILKIPTRVSNELIKKTNLCISSAIWEAKRANETLVTVNIGVGTLSIDTIQMQCKFTPSQELKNAIKQGNSVQIDPLELALEEAFSTKLISVCDEVI